MHMDSYYFQEKQETCAYLRFTGSFRSMKGFYGLVNIPTVFQDKIYQTLEKERPAWLNDIIVVTQGSKEEHKKETIHVLTITENDGYRLSETKSEFF